MAKVFGGATKDLIAILCCVALFILVISGMFSSGLKGGGQKPNTAFPWHAIFMTLTYPCLMTLGRLVYLSDEAFGLAGTHRGRTVHKWIMILATLTMFAGYICIAVAHGPKKQFFGYNATTGKWSEYRRIIHVYFGYITIALTLIQVSLGILKGRALERGKKFFKGHGNLGKVVCFMGCINVVVATRFWGWGQSMKGWTYTLTIACGIFAVVWPRPQATEGEDDRLLGHREKA